jgi:sec-independent protein translocase protein TatA
MLAFFNNLFRGPDLIILLVLGLLLFGRRLPEIGRGLGRSIVEFRKGLKGEDKPTEPPQLPQG